MKRPWRRLGFGLATLLGPRPLGFFIPYRHAAEAMPGGYPALEAIFRTAEPASLELLDQAEAYAPDIKRILAGEGPARFDQD